MNLVPVSSRLEELFFVITCSFRTDVAGGTAMLLHASIDQNDLVGQLLTHDTRIILGGELIHWHSHP